MKRIVLIVCSLALTVLIASVFMGNKEIGSSADLDTSTITMDGSNEPDPATEPLGEKTFTSEKSIAPWTRKELVRALALLDRYDAANSRPTAPKEGMISPQKARTVAGECIAFKRYDKTTSPSVTLFDECFVVEFYEFTNPFRYSDQKVSTWVIVDAWTGKQLGIRHARGGSTVVYLDRHPKDLPEAIRKENINLVRAAESELSSRVREGVPLSSPVMGGMIDPNEALAVGLTHAGSRGRSFDAGKCPTSILVNDVFVVVLWRPSDSLEKGGATYDSRIFINAYSGEVLGMEITK